MYKLICSKTNNSLIKTPALCNFGKPLKIGAYVFITFKFLISYLESNAVRIRERINALMVCFCLNL